MSLQRLIYSSDYHLLLGIKKYLASQKYSTTDYTKATIVASGEKLTSVKAQRIRIIPGLNALSGPRITLKDKSKCNVVIDF